MILEDPVNEGFPLGLVRLRHLFTASVEGVVHKRIRANEDMPSRPAEVYGTRVLDACAEVLRSVAGLDTGERVVRLRLNLPFQLAATNRNLRFGDAGDIVGDLLVQVFKFRYVFAGLPHLRPKLTVPVDLEAFGHRRRRFAFF